jgi:hypothetical protein
VKCPQVSGWSKQGIGHAKKVLSKWLGFKLHKMRLVQALTPADKLKRREYCEEMQLKMEEDGFVERPIFSDEATFHIPHSISVAR